MSRSKFTFTNVISYESALRKNSAETSFTVTKSHKDYSENCQRKYKHWLLCHIKLTLFDSDLALKTNYN